MGAVITSLVAGMADSLLRSEEQRDTPATAIERIHDVSGFNLYLLSHLHGYIGPRFTFHKSDCHQTLISGLRRGHNSILNNIWSRSDMRADTAVHLQTPERTHLAVLQTHESSPTCRGDTGCPTWSGGLSMECCLRDTRMEVDVDACDV
jgi:hypothetical protein